MHVPSNLRTRRTPSVRELSTQFCTVQTRDNNVELCGLYSAVLSTIVLVLVNDLNPEKAKVITANLFVLVVCYTK